MKKYEQSSVDRREFLKAAGATALAAGMLPRVAKADDLLPVSMGGYDPLPGACAPNEVAISELADLGIRRMSELDELPWFEKNSNGDICLIQDSTIPIIDTHSHLGWAQGFGGKIDMRRRCDVEYFYDFERDQDVIFTQDHPDSEESSQVTKEILELMFHTPDRNRTQTAANLTAEMDLMNYQNIVLLPIEIPAYSRHAKDTLAASSLDDRFVPFGAVHPFPWGRCTRRKLEKQVKKYNLQGIKFHPEFQFIAPDDDDAMEMFEWCAKHDILVYAHVGYTGSELKLMRDLAEPERFIPALDSIPNLRMVLAHTGVRLIDETLAVAYEYEDKVWVDISGQPAPNIEYIIQRYDSQKILFGSDWPFLPLSVMLARTLVATEGCPETRENILHYNAANLLGWA